MSNLVDKPGTCTQDELLASVYFGSLGSVLRCNLHRILASLFPPFVQWWVGNSLPLITVITKAFRPNGR